MSAQFAVGNAFLLLLTESHPVHEKPARRKAARRFTPEIIVSAL
jgi:hypothetical protein